MHLKEVMTASISDLDMLFNISRLRAKNKVRNSNARELLLDDDAAPIAHSEESLQRPLDKFSASYKSFGLRISLKKIVTMHQGSAGSILKLLWMKIVLAVSINSATLVPQ